MFVSLKIFNTGSFKKLSHRKKFVGNTKLIGTFYN